MTHLAVSFAISHYFFCGIVLIFPCFFFWEQLFRVNINIEPRTQKASPSQKAELCLRIEFIEDFLVWENDTPKILFQILVSFSQVVLNSLALLFSLFLLVANLLPALSRLRNGSPATFRFFSFIQNLIYDLFDEQYVVMDLVKDTIMDPIKIVHFITLSLL